MAIKLQITIFLSKDFMILNSLRSAENFCRASDAEFKALSLNLWSSKEHENPSTNPSICVSQFHRLSCLTKSLSAKNHQQTNTNNKQYQLCLPSSLKSNVSSMKRLRPVLPPSQLASSTGTCTGMDIEDDDSDDNLLTSVKGTKHLQLQPLHFGVSTISSQTTTT